MAREAREFFRLLGEETVLRYREMNLHGETPDVAWALRRNRWQQETLLYTMSNGAKFDVHTRLRCTGSKRYAVFKRYCQSVSREFGDPTRSAELRRLGDVLERDHVSGCQSNSCDISVAWQYGYFLWSAHLFQGATEMTDEFNEAYGPLADSELEEIERIQLCTIPHRTCMACEALVWDIDGFRDAVNCDNCAVELPPWKKRRRP